MEKEKMNTWIDVYQQKYKLLLNRQSSGIKRGLKLKRYSNRIQQAIIFKNLLQICHKSLN